MRCVPILFALLVVFGALTLRADDSPIIFSDDFNLLDPGWGVESAGQRVADGKLILHPAVHRSFSTLYDGSLFGDVDIRVKVSQQEGDPNQTAGIIFWAADLRNYYVAQLESDGGFGVTRWTNNRQLTPVPYAQQPALKKGLKAVNEMRVVTVGPHAAIFLNGQQVANFRGFPPAGKSKLGLHAESGDIQSTWHFSELSVRRADPGLFPSSETPREGDVLFADDFSKLDPAWGHPTDVRVIEDHALTLRPKVQTGFSNAYTGELFDDVDIHVKVRAVDGVLDRTAGIVFWENQTKDEWYVAEILPDGRAGVTRRTLAGMIAPVAYSKRACVKQGQGEVNELRVVTLGGRAAVFVNGQQIARFRGMAPKDGQLIGVHAESGEKQNTWQFSDLQVRKADPAVFSGLTAVAPADANILCADDFSTLDPAWGDEDKILRVADGKLVLTPEVGTSYADMYRGGLFTDADIRVKLTLAAGNPDQPAGVMFWATNFKNYYLAQINPRGLLGVSRIMEGKWMVTVPYLPRPMIKQGPGQTNDLRIVTKGKQVTLYANDQQVATFQGFPPEQASRIGVRATSGQNEVYTWQFSDFVVRKPE